MMKKSLTAFIFIIAIIFFLLVISKIKNATPDFTAIEDIQQRKAAFIAYLQPIINDLNQERAAERDELIRIVEEIQKDGSPGFFDKYKLEGWAERYGVDYQEDDPLVTAKALLLRLDQIPLSMVLAQAAMESAWGTSRFAIEANNYFGQWCYKQGCGIVPDRRAKSAKHEVKAFDSVDESVASYFRNINSHRAYRELRKHRALLRAKDKPVTGHALLDGLHNYSQRGQAYIDELSSVINYNNLDQLNNNSSKD